MHEPRDEQSPIGVAAVTGTSGRVGSAIAAAFYAGGWSIRGVDCAPGRWTSLLGDLRDRDVRRAALRQSDIVVHAAALHAPHVGRVDDREFRAVNVDATEALLEEADRVGVRRILYISSTAQVISPTPIHQELLKEALQTSGRGRTSLGGCPAAVPSAPRGQCLKAP